MQNPCVNELNPFRFQEKALEVQQLVLYGALFDKQ